MRERTLTVSQLNEYVKGVFEDELVLHNINVEGEIYELKQTASATFITLRDNDSLLHCVSFESVGGIQTGDRVSLFGNVTFYERNGKVSFVFKSVKKSGIGAFLAEFNALKQKLSDEGLFDMKKPIPSPIRKIAVITSETGAVIHDFIKTIHRKRNFTDVYLYPSSVQGKFAATDLIEKLKSAEKKDYDVIVIARGGGSNDDLSVFNDESLVRAVAACHKPVISAVGHETDFTLCDFAATVRAGTPSMAGEFISRHNEEFFDRLEYAVMLLNRGIDNAFSLKTSALYRAAADLSYKSAIKSERARARVCELGARLNRLAKDNLLSKSDRLRKFADKLDNGLAANITEKNKSFELAASELNRNNPLRILSLGYARVCGADGKTVSYENINVGDNINAYLSDGKISATVTEKNKGFFK